MITKITYADAIESLIGSTDFSIRNDDLDNIIWIGETHDITREQILDEQTRLQEIQDATPEGIAQKAKEDLKASAKAKLIAGEALTEEEANTIVL